MFAPIILNAWESGTIIAILAGVIGTFVVMRSQSFAAHAIPNASFAGGAASTLVGASSFVGLGLFSILSALAISFLSRRGRQDVAIALSTVTMLGLGALFLSWSRQYESAVYSLLFGQILGVSSNEIFQVAVIALIAIVGVLFLYRPLVLSSISPELAQARGVKDNLVEISLLLLVALVCTIAVPVVGALLIFSLLVAPAASARQLSSSTSVALVLAVSLALITLWSAIALSYLTNWPIGFFVGGTGALIYMSSKSLASLIGKFRPQVVGQSSH